MNVKEVISKLGKLYPGKTIIKNLDNNGIVTEIICETEPTQDHPEYSEAIAVIDNSVMHFHKKLNETYTILKGQLTVVTDVKLINLKKGDSITMQPGTVHANIGKETWCRVYSKPGWTLGDHIPLENLMKEILARTQSKTKVKIDRMIRRKLPKSD
ncbi:MAG: cupin domain-containing protein [Candidatus Gottesmanbacteria bacterium]|nr:cupin domain-containing protein [Candidatus Gottesmanbacteria bacterium]